MARVAILWVGVGFVLGSCWQRNPGTDPILATNNTACLPHQNQQSSAHYLHACVFGGNGGFFGVMLVKVGGGAMRDCGS